MRNILFKIGVFDILTGCQTILEKSLTDYVDPFIGTDETDFVSLWRIGGNQEHPHGRLAQGVLDEVMIFKGALTEDEIAKIMLKHDETD